MVLLALALGACWKGGQGVEVTSLEGRSVIGELDEARFAQLCRDIDHWNQTEFGSAKFRAAACEIESAVKLRELEGTPVSGRERCQSLARECETRGGGIPWITARCERGATRCALTVAEVEKCLDDLAYDMNIVLCTAPVCDDICGLVDPRAVDPPSCAAVEAACPELRFTRPSFERVVALDPCAGAGPATRQCVWW
jgi:hypothetical protein